MALPLDAKRFQPACDPFPVAEQVGARLAMGFFSVSANGVLAYRNAPPAARNWCGSTGKAKLWGPLGRPGTTAAARRSPPDGNRAAVDKMDAAGSRDIWYWISHAASPRSTSDAVQDHGPVCRQMDPN